MLSRSRVIVLCWGALLTAAAACSSSSSTDTPVGSDASVSEAGIKDAAMPVGDDARVPMVDASFDAGSTPYIRSFSHANGQKVVRPASSQLGDLLVLLTSSSSGGLDFTSFASPSSQESVAFCPYSSNQLAFATRVDDGTVEYTLPSLADGGTTDNSFDAMLLAIANAGPAAEDHLLTNQSSASGSSGAAAPGHVMQAVGLALVAFTTQIGQPQPFLQGDSGTGFAFFSKGQYLYVYDGLFPMGTTPALAPFPPLNDAAVPCWGTATIVIPPKK
jgi:hypothetical protein